MLAVKSWGVKKVICQNKLELLKMLVARKVLGFENWLSRKTCGVENG